MTLFALAKNGRHIWQLTPLGTAIIDTEMVGQLERPQRRITGFNASERTLVVFGAAGLADYALDSQKLSEPVDRPILNSLEAWMPRAAAGWVGYDAETTTIVYLSRSFLPEETIALEGVKNQDKKGRPIALFRPTRGTELSRGFNDFNDFNEIKTLKTPKTPSLSSPTHGIKVQRLEADGTWQNGWVIANCSDPSDITIARMGSPHLTAQHYRWQINLRPNS